LTSAEDAEAGGAVTVGFLDAFARGWNRHDIEALMACVAATSSGSPTGAFA